MTKTVPQVKQFLRESNAIENVWDNQSLKDAYTAWKYLVKQKRLTPAIVLKTHKLLMENQSLAPEEIGHWRKCQVLIGDREAIAWPLIPEQMLVWCDNANFKLEFWKASHIVYEYLHPFVDGNGRTGRG